MDDVEINTKDDFNKTPLLWATAGEHTEVVKLLLDSESIDSHTVDNFGQSPLWWAVETENEVVVELLFHRDPNIRNNISQTILRKALHKGNRRMFEALLSKSDVDLNAVDDDGQTLLLWATKRGDAVTVKTLLALNKSFDVNTQGQEPRTPLWWAVTMGNEEITRLLLCSEGVDINSKSIHGQTPLWCAISTGRLSILTILLREEGIKVNGIDRSGRTPLLLAEYYRWQSRTLREKETAANGAEKIIDLLLLKCINVNAVDAASRTALAIAAKKGQSGVAERLLTVENIDVTLQDKDGATALWHAVDNRSESIVSLLLAHADNEVNTRNDVDQSPLLIATIYGYTEIFRLLLDEDGIDINGTDLIG
ncbi:ankyrin repeats (3 copies) domain-containing protein [Trichoderma breve]|uniref:Ankyrin repeats (3 copies) domain-containing protein n=1 Tax=Trichoderma breve TaxID=2034170 RepID=A0A9W9BI58_9HYPO|nr:ankyrin repeats (3 copies) domain-containing protein [Trichoderma breve]KAJ4862694.1 ankyrin repeats (3 copies) domain-containing protein [Trichoderma breve]